MPAIKLKKVTAEYLAEKERNEAERKEKGKRKVEDAGTEEAETSEGQEEEEEEVKPRNFLEVEILHDKRKRALPAVEQDLVEWLDSNLMKKDEVYLPLLTLYNYYSEVCQMKGQHVVDVPVFNRYVRDKFGKFFGFQDNSPYRVLIKERKVKEKKAKVQGETLQIKIRDIITEVINDLGNPHKGLRFQVISKAIIQKYPAQRVDIYPKKLRSALERGVYYGYIELVRGVGMCGYYRVPGDPTKEEEDKKPKQEADKSVKDADEEQPATENGEAGRGEGESPVKEPGEDKEKEKVDKEGADKEAGEVSGEAATEEKKKKKRVHKKPKKKAEAWARKQVARHSNPQHVEDTFPLAITYQSDPKEASLVRIKAYIAKFYYTDVGHDRLKKALDKGCENGTWEQIGGKYHLLVESFNPGRSSSLSDQIAQALVACSEPKQASASMIKKYITQYHPALGVEAKPHLFRSALDRANTRGVIRQLSGIGASGTFQLVDQFFPSPNILAGDSSDDESGDDEESSDEDQEYVVPKSTKSGRKVVKAKLKQAPESTRRVRNESSAKQERTAQKRGRKEYKKSKYTEASSSEEEGESEEEEVVTPSKSRSRGGSATGKTAAKPSGQPKAKAAKKAPTTPAKKAASVKAKTPAKSPAKTPRAQRERPNYRDDDSDDEIAEALQEYTPRPSKSRGASTDTPASGGRGRATERNPQASAAKKTPAKSEATTNKRRQPGSKTVQVLSESEDEAPAAKKAKGGTKPAARAKKAAVTVCEDSSEEEEAVQTSPNKGARSSAKKETKKPAAKSPAKKKRR